MAYTWFAESLAIRRELGEKRGIATALNNLGWVAHHQGDYVTARVLHQESLLLQQALGNTGGTAFALTNLAWAMHQQGDSGPSTALLEEALTLFEAVGMKQLYAFASCVLGDIAHMPKTTTGGPWHSWRRARRYADNSGTSMALSSVSKA